MRVICCYKKKTTQQEVVQERKETPPPQHQEMEDISELIGEPAIRYNRHTPGLVIFTALTREISFADRIKKRKPLVRSPGMWNIAEEAEETDALPLGRG